MMKPETQQTVDPERQSPTARSRWTMPAVVFGLLGGHMVFILIAITLATGDRSFAVVPEYYQKAVAFDDRKAALAASEAMGWSVQLRPATSLSPAGQRELIVQITDTEGKPVTGRSVRLGCYHFSRADEPLAFELIEALPGQYVGADRLSREGFWWFELSVAGGGQPFVAEFKQFVSAAEATP